MAAIRPDEVSNIIREQLAGVNSVAQLEEVGTVNKINEN